MKIIKEVTMKQNKIDNILNDLITKTITYKEAKDKLFILFGVTKRKPIWITLEGYRGETILKQHAFIPKISNGGNIRNVSLCGKIHVGNDDEKSALFDTITDRAEMIEDSNICKKCKQIYLSNYAL